jgi:glycosyltransferase involved in cell wall biosynthesis
MSERRVLIVAHSHPDIIAGGGEIAAYQMFEEIRSRPGWSAVFMGRARSPAGGEPYFAKNGEDDYVVISGATPFDFQQIDRHFFLDDFAEMLLWLRPDVIHFHHYLHLGVEPIKVARRTLPGARIILTLHEYLAICANNGQMVTQGKHELCERASFAACSRCFPERTMADFFLRKFRIQGFFADVDRFISPSQFLKDRYVDWGIPPERISVLENGQPPHAALPARPPATGESTRGRFAFFGQINPFKGVVQLLEAMRLIPDALRAPNGPISLIVAGNNPNGADTVFSGRIQSLAERLDGGVHLTGRYRSTDLPSMMARIDWVVVPSIWWENSPLVIQEAKKFGRPLIVSGIGGMAEKVRNEVEGLHALPGNPHSLAEAIIRAATTPGLFETCRSNLRRPPTISETVDEVLNLYFKPS